MISLPDETIEDIDNSIEYIKKYRHIVSINPHSVTTIFPGTELEKMAKSRGILKDDFSWFDRDYVKKESDLGYGTNVPIWIEHISAQILREYIRKYKYKVDLPLRLKIKRNIISFFFYWSKNDVESKITWVKNLGEIIKSRMVSSYN